MCSTLGSTGRQPSSNGLSDPGVRKGRGPQRRQDGVTGVLPLVRVTAAEVAVLVAGRPLLGESEELWVAGDEAAICVMLSGARRIDLQTAADYKQDLQDVLADELNDVRHYPRLGQLDDPFEVTLPNEAVVMSGVQAMQNRLADRGQGTERACHWLIVVEPVWDGNLLVVYPHGEWRRRREPGCGHQVHNGFNIVAEHGWERT
jgi:hypothetical protein